jgi:hypothetical protein
MTKQTVHVNPTLDELKFIRFLDDVVGIYCSINDSSFGFVSKANDPEVHYDVRRVSRLNIGGIRGQSCVEQLFSSHLSSVLPRPLSTVCILIFLNDSLAYCDRLTQYSV